MGKISAVEKTLNQDLLQLIRNKKGMLNLRVGQMLIHDKNNPHQEAKAFIQSQKISRNIPISFSTE